VDIFDAGPVLEADTDQIRAVRDSQCLPAQQLMGDLPAPTLVANGQFDNFGRCWWPTKSRSHWTPPRWTRCRSVKPTAFIR
jgi:arginine/ornithine N-succinyltransferase beta subunit